MRQRRKGRKRNETKRRTRAIFSENDLPVLGETWGKGGWDADSPKCLLVDSTNQGLRTSDSHPLPTMAFKQLGWF